MLIPLIMKTSKIKEIGSIISRAYIFLFMLCMACNPNEPGVESISVILSTGNNTSEGVACNVNITADTSKVIFLEKGICYGVSAKPTADSSKVLYQGRENAFTLVIKDFKPATTYNVRGYTKTKNGYIYSNTVQIKTVEIISDYDPTNVVNQYEGYTLAWSDEFNVNGKLSDDWGYDIGQISSVEAQYYSNSLDNVAAKDGCLVITALKNNAGHNYTSGSVNTKKSHAFMYGRFEIRAKIPVEDGSFPSIWTLGNDWDWPSGGEIDIMEYYTGNILSNVVWGSDKAWMGIWDSSKKPLSDFTNKDPEWLKKFHVWRLDWDYSYIRIYIDGGLMNEIDLSTTFNQGGFNGNVENPFRYQNSTFGQYFIFNLILGGHNGGTIDVNSFPREFKIDYIRVYKTNI